MNLLDSHDMPRFLTLAAGGQVGPPVGNALPDDLHRCPFDLLRRPRSGMPGKHDPDNRRAFPGMIRRVGTGSSCTISSGIIAQRDARRPRLRRRSFQILLAQGDVLAHARQLDEETVIVVINSSRPPSAWISRSQASFLKEAASTRSGTTPPPDLKETLSEGSSSPPAPAACSPPPTLMKSNAPPPLWQLPEGVSRPLGSTPTGSARRRGK